MKKAIEKLEEQGFEAYIVGGCLRNILMGKEPHDWDMTTSALPEKTAEIFRSEGYSVIETGLKHGTVTVLIDGVPLEITTFRIDGEYTDSRHPDSVTFTRSLSEDLARRDFTVNAMAYSEKTGLIDLYGGKADLAKKLLRAVGDPERRFTEDALRILRAFRFSAEHGFKIEEETRKAIIKCRGGLADISRERIYSELYRALTGDFASVSAAELIDCGIMSFIFPFYDEYFAPRTDVLDLLPKRIAPRLACFIINFNPEEAEKALISLKMSNADKSAVKSILSAVDLLKNQPFGDVVSARRFIRLFGENGADAITLADLLGIDVERAKKAVNIALQTDFPKSIGDLAIGGSEVIALGASGRMTGEILSFLLEKATEDPTLNTPLGLTELTKKYISENKNEHNDH
ncbi:MAG: hypothetical protein IJZ89_07930 [Clostridia bacterium]|nr:hypothetical protein [Clostridia bacterium]